MGQTIQGKTALITGAGKGIGKAPAIALAKEGVNVGLFARTEEDLKKTASELEQYGVKVAYFAGDVSSMEQVDEGVKQLTEQLGTFDILINNASRVEENHRYQPDGCLLCDKGHTSAAYRKK